MEEIAIAPTSIMLLFHRLKDCKLDSFNASDSSIEPEIPILLSRKFNICNLLECISFLINLILVVVILLFLRFM